MEYHERVCGLSVDELIGTNSQPSMVIGEELPVMMSFTNELAAVINQINNNIISDWKSKDAADPLLLYFLANCRAFYDNFFVSTMMEEVKAW